MLLPKTVVDTIAQSASVSSGADAHNLEVTGVIMTDSYDNTEFTLQASYDGGDTYYPVVDAFGNDVTVGVENKKYSLPIDAVKDVTAVRLSGASPEATAEVNITWIFKKLV